MNDQRRDSCPDCGTARSELVVAPGRFYCPTCAVAGPGPHGDVGAEQLDLFHQPAESLAPSEPPPAPAANGAEPPPRRTQLTELPGTTWEDIFDGPPSRSRSAA